MPWWAEFPEGAQAWGGSDRVFFLKAVLLDDSDDTTSADRDTGLAKLLHDDFERGVGIEEAVANDLANDLVGADIVAFGAWFVAKES